jgi:hypothetical protein
VSGWVFWVLSAVLLAIIVLAGTAVLFLAGTLAVSSREAAAERERGIEA